MECQYVLLVVKKTTSDIVAKLSGYDVEIKDGRVNKLIDIYAAKENPVLFVEKVCGLELLEYQKVLLRQMCGKEEKKNVRIKNRDAFTPLLCDSR